MELLYQSEILQEINPIVVPWSAGSHVWKKMIECRDLIEHQILWHPKMGSSLFWFENWTGLGALFQIFLWHPKTIFVTPPDFSCDESIHNIYDVVIDGQRDEELASHILENIKPPVLQEMHDKPYWMLEIRGEFSVKSAWEYLRRRKEPCNAYRIIWVKGLPFKISFFMWKVLKNKLPLDDFLKRLECLMASRCWCCANAREETMHHLFVTSYAAKKVWSYFLNNAGIGVEGITFHQAVTKCWSANVIPRSQPIMQALPSIIVWELWKTRNIYKHGIQSL